jgi:hypothetical protein
LCETVAVPITVPPLEQFDGAVRWGPNVIKLIAPVGFAPEESAAGSREGVIELSAVAVAGALTDSVGLEGAALSKIPCVLPETSR